MSEEEQKITASKVMTPVTASDKGNKLSTKQIITISVTVAILIAFIAFIAQNWNRIEIEFLFWNFRIRIIFLIVLSAFAGGISTFSIMKYRERKIRKKAN